MARLSKKRKPNLGRRRPIFAAFTLSCNDKFTAKCLSEGKDPYNTMKGYCPLLFDAFFRTCMNRKIIYILEYKTVNWCGHCHVHGTIYATCREAKKILIKLWQKYGLGYGEYKDKDKKGNCDFEDITDY